MKRILLCLFILTALMSPINSSADGEQSAQKLDYTYSIETPESTLNILAGIQDNNYTTRYALDVGNTLHIKTSGATWINIKFYGSAPESYTVTALGDTAQTALECGGTGFLHEVTRLPFDASEIMLSCPEKINIAEIEVYSNGVLPENVQRWEKTMSRCDVLIISTHSDDDTLFFGALTAEQTALGRLVQTAFICNHSQELHRLNEMLDGQWTLGVTAYPIVGYFDDLYSNSLQKAEAQYDAEEMTRFIVECVRRTRPLVLVTHDINGEYGHGAHRLVSKLTRESIELFGDPLFDTASADKYGTHTPSKTYIHLYKENEIILDVHKEMDALDGSSPFEVAEDAYECHKSQHKRDFKVTTRGTDDCRRFGLYHSEVSCDTADTDIMNGITPIFPTVSATGSMKKDTEIRAFNTNTSPAHDTTDKFELFSIFSHDSNGYETKVPKSSVAVCIGILMLAAAYGLYRLVKNIRS